MDLETPPTTRPDGSPCQTLKYSDIIQRSTKDKFCDIPECVSLLVRVLEFISKSISNKDIDFETYTYLDKSLQALILVLLESATHGWEEYCAMIGTCLR